MPGCPPIPPAAAGDRRWVHLAVGALGVSCVMTQLALLRELLCAFSGNELVLGVVLGNWLLLMGAGTWLGRAADRLRKPWVVLVVLQSLVAVLPLLQVCLLRALRNVVFVRGAAVGAAETAGAVFLLLLPYCVVAGGALTLACSLLARRDGAQGIGRVYVADSLGSIAGGVLFSFVLVRFLDHAAILVWPAVLNLLVAGMVGIGVGQRWLPALAGVLAAAVVAAAALVDLDALSTGWQYPRQHIVARANSPYGKLLVTESAGQFDFIANGIPLASTRDDQHVEETVHYAMAQRPEARTVLVVGGGFSGTAREILKYKVARVDYVELDPVILEFGRRFLPGNLADQRITTRNTDGRLFIKQSGDKYDVVIVDVPVPSTAQLNRFFTAGFFAEVKRILAPGGLVSVPLGAYANYVSPELARMLASATRSLELSFRNTLAVPGGQVFLLGSDGPLSADIAPRIAQQGVPTKLMNRHYLDAMLAPDRLADLQRATAQPAAPNTDFSPVLHYYHLGHWLSQFRTGFGAFPVALLVVLAVYLLWLRGTALVVFASGFAGTALEVVLLLAFQILCGSVYHQVGIIVTVFMAGLALGAVWGNRLPVRCRRRDANQLACLALAVAGYAAVLPAVLPALGRAEGVLAAPWAVKGTLALLTLVLALVVGMQFPLANRLVFDGTVAGASRLYTADFIGAFVGALLAGTLLVPLIGVAGVCSLTAALNALAGAVVVFQKPAT